MFTKVNLGKIPLTNAELIKALLLNKENFSADIGERLAKGNATKQAENKLWELEGYRLYSA